VGWLDGKAARLLNPPNDGTQNVISIPAFPGGQPNYDGALYPDSGYQSAAAAGYGRNELVYACIRERAENLPQSVLRVYPGDQPAAQGEPLESHRLRQLIARPNPVCGEFEFFELSVTYLDLAGNCYWLIQRGRDGPRGVVAGAPGPIRICRPWTGRELRVRPRRRRRRGT
jgi:phage portal protein BeeE